MVELQEHNSSAVVPVVSILIGLGVFKGIDNSIMRDCASTVASVPVPRQVIYQGYVQDKDVGYQSQVQIQARELATKPQANGLCFWLLHCLSIIYSYEKQRECSYCCLDGRESNDKPRCSLDSRCKVTRPQLEKLFQRFRPLLA